MNYLPYIGWGFYGAASSTERANFWASWGMMDVLIPPVPLLGLTFLAKARSFWMHMRARRKMRGGRW